MPAVRTRDASSSNPPWDSSLSYTQFESFDSDTDTFLRSLKHSRVETDKKKSRSQQKGKPYSKPATYTVGGVQLQPTVAFDTFWRFAAERKALDDRRRAGYPAPWTDDPILQKYHFCNTFRVLDRVSQYLIREVIEKGPQDPVEVSFRVILFNLFTKIETWELLNKRLGPLTWETYDRMDYQRVLGNARTKGSTLYTGAFIKPAPAFGFESNHVNHLNLLEVLMENNVSERLLRATYMADVFEYLVSFPSMGDFTTYQLMLNLSYTEILNFHRNDFVVPGPGASSGLEKMFGKAAMASARASVRGFEILAIQWLTKTQKEHFKRLGLQFSGLGPENLPMDVADIEHTLCEVDKYCRLAHPKFKGKRTELRRAFVKSTAVLPAVPSLPRAWSHSARKTPRIRSEQKLTIEKRYTVDRVGKHREGPAGTEYLVFWLGYRADAATWEPEDGLLADAPAVLEEYWGKKR